MAKQKSSTSPFDNPVYKDEEIARKHLESIRWPNGPVCPHCGCDERIMQLKGKATRPGVYKCGDCRKQFTVTVHTVFEGSHIPINKWILATHLMCSSKKGFSAHQLHRVLGVSYKTAWFMEHRLREAMRDPMTGKMGGGGKTVEADETFIGRKTTRLGEKRPSGYADKQKVLSLVERNGKVRSFHVPAVNAETLRPILKQQIEQDTHLMTDDAGWYRNSKADNLGEHFNSHEVVSHAEKEYVRGNAHVNTAEGFFGIMKRGLNGVYQHWSQHQLHRYLNEYDFRYNYREKQGYDDTARTNQALRGIEGKRLTYNPSNAQ